MKRSVKMSMLAAAVALAGAASQAQAGYGVGAVVYDLRFAAAGNPTNPDAGNVHQVTNPAAGNYTAYLYMQVTGTDGVANEGMQQGFVSLQSGTTATQLLTNGGVTNVVLNSAIAATVNQPAAASNTSTDGVADWGSADTSANSGWIGWTNTAMLLGDGSHNGDHQVNSNTWEFLVATVTVQVGNTSVAGNTEINTVIPAIPSGVFGWTTGKTKSVVVQVDGALSNTGLNNTSAAADISAGTGLSFVATVPEPASLGVLALGGLALLARRRKTA